MRPLLLILVVGCVDEPGPPHPLGVPVPSASSQPVPSASVSKAEEDRVFEARIASKNQAIQGCLNQGGIPAMGYGWMTVCIEGQVRAYDAETDKVIYSSSYKSP